jgi:Mn2+/Fe2+ NRAMP family transporter
MYTIIKFSYVKIARILKWLCLTLILYIIVPFFIKLNWKDVAINTFIPTIHFNKEFLEILVALLGTTISPYLFFWQAIMEAEDANHNTKKVIINKQILGEMETDVNIGTLASCLVMFFIILTTGAVLHNSGIHQINTVDEAAKALEPLTGKFSYLCFAIGVLGTGFLAIPVLGGSLSYIVAETFGWEQGLDKKFYEAKGFYLVIIASLLIGLGINFVGISPVKALFYTAILYGLCSPILIAIIMHIANNKKVMKKHTNTKLSNVLGTITLLIMTAAAVAMIYLQFV